MKIRHSRMIIGVVLLVALVGCSGGGAAATDLPPAPTGDGVETGVSPVSGAYTQSQVASQHAALGLTAATGGDLNGARQHAEHVINIIVGETSGDQFGIAFGDHDGNGTAENPGDGVGVWPYTNDAIAQLDALLEGVDTPEDQKPHLTTARQCLINLREQAKVALDQAQAVLASPDAPSAASAAQTMAAAADAGALGIDADGNGSTDPIVGECGAEQAYDVLSLNIPTMIQP
jgi:hypothetical protein